MTPLESSSTDPRSRRAGRPRRVGARLALRAGATATLVTTLTTVALLAGCSTGTAPVAASSVVTATASNATSTSPASTPTSSVTAEPTSTPTAPPQPTVPVVVPALMTKGAESAQVRELQARLVQLKLFKGSPTGSYGPVTADAVMAFQAGKGLTATGEVDQATWDALLAATTTPPARELDPPILTQGATGAKVRELQARLKQLGLWSGDVTPTYAASTTAAVKTFQGKRGLTGTGEVDRATWSKLVSLTRTPTVYELNNTSPEVAAAAAAAGLDPRCLVGRVLCASKQARKLYWVIDGVVQLTLDARFGKPQFPSDNGLFHVYAKDRDAYSYKYDAPMPFALYYNGGEAVHYSSGFAAQGWNGGSHGCVNIRDKARMIWLFDQARVGDTVVVY